MNKLSQTTMTASVLLISSCLFAQGTVADPGGQIQSREQRQQINGELQRFQRLVKSKDYSKAESVLVLVASYKGAPSLTREYASLNLWRKDYRGALTKLRQHFDGDAKRSVSISGAQDLRAWYWLLTWQLGEQKRADQVLADLLQDKLRNPFGGGWYEPEKASKNKLAQVYLYMADYSLFSGNYYRCDEYLKLATTIDRKAVIHPGFEKVLSTHGPLTWKSREADERLPMLSHTDFLKKTGNR